MTTDQNPLNSLAGTITSITKEVYSDVASPAAKKVGVALETVFKVSLSPISMLDWGFEQTKGWLAQKVEDRMNRIPIENRTTPRIQIAVAAVNGVAACADTPSLRDLYAELLLKAIDRRTEDLVHPSFATVIEQLTPGEALIIMSLSSRAEDCLFHEEQRAWVSSTSSKSLEAQFVEHCETIGLADRSDMFVALVNLQRLGLLKIERASESRYVPEDGYGNQPSVDTVEYRDLYVTEFGQSFLLACSPSDAG